MKRSLIIVVPLLFLVLLNACDTGNLPPFSPSQWAAIELTQQATAMPQSQRIKNLLNNTLNFDRFSQLEEKVVGTYDVTGVDFPYGTYFQVHMNCQCAEGSTCCDRRRMFLIVVWRLSLSKNEILADMPDTVQLMNVVCYNNNSPFAVEEAPWETVKGFLNGDPNVSAA